MKKLLLSLLLCLCFVVPCAVGLSGCGHEHDFLETWTFNSTHHWHECEDCDEVKGKAEHEWDAGVITTAPTPTADGVKKFTCEVCGKTKTEAVAYVPRTTVTSSEWNTALTVADSRVKVELVAGAKKVVAERQGDATHRFEYNNNVLIEEAYYVKSGTSFYKYVVDETTYYKEEISSSQYNSGVNFSLECTYNADAYSETTKAYEFPTGYGSTTNAKFYFEDAKLVKATWVGYNDDTTPVEIKFEYGNTVVTVPTQNVVTVTVSASEWALALALENKTNYQITQVVGRQSAVTFVKNGDKSQDLSGANSDEYAQKDGSNYYFYSKVGGSEAYTKTSTTEVEYKEYNNLFSHVDTSFANFTYVDGAYYRASGMGEFTNIRLYFEDGVLVKFAGTIESQEVEMLFTYDEVVVNLPDVE